MTKEGKLLYFYKVLGLSDGMEWLIKTISAIQAAKK